MAEFISDELFLSRILKQGFTSNSPIAPVRKLARMVYDQTASNSNHIPILASLLPGEAEAARETGQALDSAKYHKLAKKWPELTPEEKIDQTWRMTTVHLAILARFLGDELSGIEGALDYFDLMPLASISSIGFIESGKAASITHLTPGDDIGEFPENYIMILKYNGESVIDTFDGAVETSLYIAARLHQTRLAIVSEKMKLPDTLNKAARLFQLAEDLTPYTCDNGNFIWGVDEFNLWLEQPKYRHAFAYIQAAMQEYKLDVNYRLPPEFLEGWKTAFYNECLDHALMSGDVAFFHKKTGTSPRLDLLEKIIPALGQHIRQIDESKFNNITRYLCQAQQRHPVLRDQVKKICAMIAPYYPAFTLMDIDDSIKPLVPDRQVLESIKTLPQEIIAGFDDRERNGVLTKLYNIAVRNPDLKMDAADLAVSVEFQSMNLDFLDEIEEGNLKKFNNALNQRPDFEKIKASWATLSVEDKCAHLLEVARLYARVFGSVSPADCVLTFSKPAEFVSRDSDSENPKKFITQGFAITIGEKTNRAYLEERYPDFDASEEGRIIAVNIHEDCKALNNYEVALGLICHEQAHLDEERLSIQHDGDELIPSDPYEKFALLMARDFNPWRAGDIEETDELYMKFYRVSIRERHAFGIQEKLMAIREGRPIPTEEQIFARALASPMMA